MRKPKHRFNKYKNIVTDDIFYALADDPVKRTIDGEEYLEVTMDFKRAHLVLMSSLLKVDTVEFKL